MIVVTYEVRRRLFEKPRKAKEDFEKEIERIQVESFG